MLICSVCPHPFPSVSVRRSSWIWLRHNGIKISLMLFNVKQFTFVSSYLFFEKNLAPMAKKQNSLSLLNDYVRMTANSTCIEYRWRGAHVLFLTRAWFVINEYWIICLPHPSFAPRLFVGKHTSHKSRYARARRCDWVCAQCACVYASA